jgi:hypothetical protein
MPYGVFVSAVAEGEEARRRTLTVFENVILPSAGRHLRDFKAHMASYLVKLPGPDGRTHPHRDWDYVDDAFLGEHPSVTVWIALGDYGEEEGALGFVPGSHRLSHGVNPSPAPAAPMATSELTLSYLPGFKVVSVRAGDAIAFDTRVIHASLPNLGSQPRMAAAIGLTPAPAVLHHYFLEPGTSDSVLKLEVTRDFFIRHTNADLQALWCAGRIPEGAKVKGRLPYRPERVTVAALERLAEAMATNQT